MQAGPGACSRAGRRARTSWMQARSHCAESRAAVAGAAPGSAPDGPLRVGLTAAVVWAPPGRRGLQQQQPDDQPAPQHGHVAVAAAEQPAQPRAGERRVYGLNGWGGITGSDLRTGARRSFWGGSLMDYGSIAMEPVNTVPEPSPLLLLGAAVVAVTLRRPSQSTAIGHQRNAARTRARSPTRIRPVPGTRSC